MILSVSINAYQYQDLSHEAKQKVISMLDNDPLDYEDDYGVIHFRYFSECSDKDIEEHCNMNNYLFNKYGSPINNLIL